MFTVRVYKDVEYSNLIAETDPGISVPKKDI